jgi:S1-C subfamily serine protease
MMSSIKLVAASLLLVSLLALGGLSVAATGLDGAFTHLWASTGTTGQKIEALQTVQVANSATPTTGTDTQAAQPRPFLGVEYMAITPQVAAYYNLPLQSGIYVNSVAANSPAARAGITANSIITRFDGTTLDENNTLVEILLNCQVGESVRLSFVPPNSNTEKEVTVVLGSRPGKP